MTKIIVLFLNFYQIFVSPFLKLLLGGSRFCRFEETCSDYTKRMVLEKGTIKGLSLGFIRLLKCQPFYHGSLRRENINGSV